MDEAIIAKVRSNECLYNNKANHYRDLTFRRGIWDKIGKELDITGVQAKSRWDTLRRCYSNARHRRRESGCKTPWKYEKQMCFLLPFIEQRAIAKIATNNSTFVDVKYNSKDFMVEGYDSEESTNFKTEKDVNIFDAENEENFEFNKATINYTDSDGGNSEQSFENTTSTSIKANVNNENQNAVSTKRTFDEIDTSSNFANSNNVLENFDNMDLFFLSMSRMTKQLPKAEQTKIKLELSKLVLTAELKQNE